MNTINLIHDFLFGKKEDLGIDIVSSDEILFIMNNDRLDSDKNVEDFPYALDVKNILFNKKNNTKKE